MHKWDTCLPCLLKAGLSCGEASLSDWPGGLTPCWEIPPQTEELIASSAKAGSEVNKSVRVWRTQNENRIMMEKYWKSLLITAGFRM
jgi:hypothetical protein